MTSRVFSSAKLLLRLSQFAPLYKDVHVEKSCQSDPLHVAERHFSRLAVNFVCLLAIVLFVTPLQAQVTTADILGTVTDTTGAIVPSATVTATNTATGLVRTQKVSSNGEFTFTQLQPGPYRLVVSANAFKTLTISALTLAAGDRTRADAKLDLGDVSQTVDVQSSAVGLQTDTSTVSSTINQQATQNLPLNGRNFVNLVQVQVGINPGVPNSVAGGNRPDDRRQSSSISANGEEELFNLFLLDGLENSDRASGLIAVQPSIDAIQEVKVNTNLYNAELGRTAGAVVSIITKAGTNTLHGTVYEFFRNDITDARNFFAAGIRKPELRQNQFGASVGGPILKNRTFFFGDYEGFRQIDGTQTVYTSTVPTLFEHNNPGNLSDIRDPASGLPGPIIANPDPTSLGYFKLLPAPNQAGIVDPSTGIVSNNFLYNPTRNQQGDTFDVRIDHSFNQANLLFARYSFNNVNTQVPGELPPLNGVQAGGAFAGTFPGFAKERAQNGQVNYTRIFSSALLLELRGSGTRLVIDSYPLNYGSNLNNTPPYSIPGANSALEASGLATMVLNGYAPLGDAIFVPIENTQNTFQFAGAVTYTKGSHTFKSGAGVIRRQISLFQNPFGKGFFIWALGGNQLQDLAEFLRGTPFLYERTNQLERLPLRIWEPSVYAQDDWRVTKAFTVNLGIRYDIFGAAKSPTNQLSNLDLTTGKLIVSNTGGVTTRYTNLAPRLGFTSTVAPHTVLRGGFGITFFPTDIQGALPVDNPPNTFASGVLLDMGTLSGGIPAPTVPSTTNLTGSLNSKPLHYRAGYVEQFNLILERELGRNIFSVGYVAGLGRRQYQQVFNANLPDPGGPTGIIGPAPYATLLPNVNTIGQFLDKGASSYNSLQTSFTRQYSNGINMNANYTYGRSLDDLNDGAAFLGTAYSLLPRNIGTYDYGNSSQDIRHRFAATANYTLPFGKGATGARALAVAGYEVNALGFWQSGSAYTVLNSNAQINLPTVTTDRPDIIGNPDGNHSLAQFFNTSAFAYQTFGTAGNESPNKLYGPHQRRVDLSIFKTVTLHEQTKLQLRAECFNISNTPNFGLPNNTISSTALVNGREVATNAGGFGSVTTTTLSARQFQFAAKIIF